MVKMNILYIGEETRNWVMRLVNELSLLGHTITVIVKKYDEYDNDNRVIPLRDVRVLEVEDNAYFKPETIYNLIKHNKYDIVYGSHIIACTPVKYIAEKMGLPYGIQVLDIPMDLMLQNTNRMRNWLYYFKTLEDVTTMTFITKKARDDWKHYTGQDYDDSHVIHYAIHVPEEYKLSGLDEDDGYIVSFCRVCPMKNVSQATKSLVQLRLPVKQVVVGKSQGDVESIMLIANQHGLKAVHVAQVSEEQKFELIKNATAVVYPQISEYIGGLSPFEAMFIGTPVVCYDYDILKSLYGTHAFYADKSVPGTFTHVLAYALTVNKSFIKDRLVKASTHAGKNTFKNMAVKLGKVMEDAIK